VRSHEHCQHHEPETFCARGGFPLPNALAPRRRQSLSTRSHPSVHGSPVDAIQTPAKMPTTLCPPPMPQTSRSPRVSVPTTIEARRRHQIPIALAASHCQTARDFVPWRFSDAGHQSASIAHHSGVRETCTRADINRCTNRHRTAETFGQILSWLLETVRLRSAPELAVGARAEN
jgi:hypothetical protein